jgi:hypothetical protein
MSTKTTFKRIALVAVAALGLGVLSVAPSSAAVSDLTITVTNGATTLRSGSTTLVDSDTTTGATIAISALRTATTDSITVAFFNKGTLASGVTSYLSATETTTSVNSLISDGGLGTYNAATLNSGSIASIDSSTAGVTTFGITGAANLGSIGANFKLALDSKTASLGAGTYTYTVVVSVASINGGQRFVTETAKDVSIVVAAGTAASLTPSAAYSTAYLNTSSGQTSDTAGVSQVSTAGTRAAYLTVDPRNASNNTGAEETVTVTITGPGLVNNGTASGKSLVTRQTALVNYEILADGNAGATTITVVLSTTGQTFTKGLTFYAKNATTITPSVRTPALKVGTNSEAVGITAVDVNGNAWTGTAYMVASSAADALIAGSETPVACNAYDVVKGIRCDVTALTVGTAKFKIIDASTVATAKATSAEFSVTVSAATAASVKVEFDKTTYGPYEKAIITVYPVDAAGNTIPAGTFATLLASGGITANQSFTGTSDTLTPVSITTSTATSSTSGTVALKKVYTVYMPAQGDVVLTWTGGASLPASGQVKGTATVTVVNSSVDAATDAANEATDAANAATDAALAAADAADAATAAAQDASDAVAALSATVAKLVASLKAQITSLTNLVIKIQKKVKA